MEYMHVWVWDPTEDGVLICSNCDTRKGSRASSQPCYTDQAEPLDGKGSE